MGWVEGAGVGWEKQGSWCQREVCWDPGFPTNEPCGLGKFLELSETLFVICKGRGTVFPS